MLFLVAPKIQGRIASRLLGTWEKDCETLGNMV